MAEVSWVELHWNRGCPVDCRPYLLGVWSRTGKKSCRQAFSPARILSRQSCGGNRAFVWLLLPPGPQTLGFLPEWKELLLHLHIREVGGSGQDREREAAPLTEAPPP